MTADASICLSGAISPDMSIQSPVPLSDSGFSLLPYVSVRFEFNPLKPFDHRVADEFIYPHLVKGDTPFSGRSFHPHPAQT